MPGRSTLKSPSSQGPWRAQQPISGRASWKVHQTEWPCGDLLLLFAQLLLPSGAVLLGLLIRQAIATFVGPGAVCDSDALCCFCRAGQPGKDEAWQQLVALMGPSNVEVADGDAPAINSILDMMMIASSNSHKMQLMALLMPAFKQASCCAGFGTQDAWLCIPARVL